ncbi:serine hydrolase domain-containing protein [Viridibacillus soli]|uniref:hypothetical protein n=1 Tax=Viridibacillus soli TaxID=2798301 RepID=UPI001F3D8E14|nr:hypothetical protein [Viridibacillus soli]
MQESTLISRDLTEKMFKPYLNSYACGWAVSSVLDRQCTSHFGNISGFSNDFIRFVDDNISIIFLSNMNITPVLKLTREIAEVIFSESVSLPEPAVPIIFPLKEKVCGTYIFREDTENKSLEITIKNNELYVTLSKMYGAVYKFKLVPIKRDKKQTTFITEMIHEVLVIYYSVDKLEIEYTDYHGNHYILYKKSN